MRLRELKFPIAVLRPGSLIGGEAAGLGSAKWYDFNLASYYLKGAYDNATIYDSNGEKYVVVSIELTRPNWVHYLLDLAGNFFIPRRDAEPMARVDMTLGKVGQLSLIEFCEEIRNVALSHPSWWQRHSNEAEVTGMFDGCTTFEAAINSIGVLDPPGTERLGKESSKVVDLR